MTICCPFLKECPMKSVALLMECNLLKVYFLEKNISENKECLKNAKFIRILSMLILWKKINHFSSTNIL